MAHLRAVEVIPMIEYDLRVCVAVEADRAEENVVAVLWARCVGLLTGESKTIGEGGIIAVVDDDRRVVLVIVLFSSFPGDVVVKVEVKVEVVVGTRMVLVDVSSNHIR